MRFSHLLRIAGAALIAACGNDHSAPSNAPPTAVFTVQCTGSDCTFTNGSSDPDGSIERYLWNFGERMSEPVTTQDAAHTYATPIGRYTVKLTVIDDDGAVASATREVDFSMAAPATDFTWTSLAPMPEPRTWVGAAALDGVVYVVGGVAASGNGSVIRPDIFAYDPATDTWRTAGRLLVPVRAPGVVTLGDRIYIVGGWAEEAPVADVQIFDPATGRIERGPPMPTARSSAAVAVLDGRLHAIGSATLDEFPMSSWTDVHEVFDPFTGTWSSRARPPSVGGGYAAAAIGGRLYLVDNGWEQQLHVYEPAADSWTTIAAPQGRSDAAAATLGGKVYVLGGGEYQLDCCSGTIPVAVVDRLDPHTGVWDRVPPMPTPRSGHGAAVVGQSIYVIGGSPIGPNIGFGAVNERLTAR